MKLRSSLVRLSAALAGVALIACAGAGGGSGAYSYGYMIPGATVASALRIAATDTIGEFSGESALPPAVRTGISQEITTGRWAAACTRRFGNSNIYPVMFFRSCDPGRGTESDPVVLVGFGPDGRVVGRVQWTGPGTVTLLSPARRF